MTILDAPTEEDNKVSKNIQLDSDLSEWLDSEANLLGMTPSILVATLLEWARSEGITRDDDMMVFAGRGIS